MLYSIRFLSCSCGHEMMKGSLCKQLDHKKFILPTFQSYCALSHTFFLSMYVHFNQQFIFDPTPSCSSSYKTMLADHCATPIGLRLSPDGYLTGDFNLDFPPMRYVLIDPYTG